MDEPQVTRQDAKELLDVFAGRNKKPWWKSKLLLLAIVAVLNGVWTAHEQGLSLDACLWAGFGALVGIRRIFTTTLLTLRDKPDEPGQ
jgi:hypothetical protein